MHGKLTAENKKTTEKHSHSCRISIVRNYTSFTYLTSMTAKRYVADPGTDRIRKSSLRITSAEVCY